MADELDVDAMLARFRDRAARVKERGMPPVAGPERERFLEQAALDFQDFAIVGDATWTFEAGILTLRVDPHELMDFLDHADLTGRIRGLVIMLDDKVTIEQSRAVDELIDASEFGVALETLADFLAISATPVPDDLRDDFERLATRMEIRDAVMETLSRCPAEG